MPIRLNVLCNGQIAANEKYLSNFDQINWGPGHIERDEFGIPIKKDTSDDDDFPKAKITGCIVSLPGTIGGWKITGTIQKGQEDFHHVAHLPKR